LNQSTSSQIVHLHLMPYPSSWIAWETKNQFFCREFPDEIPVKIKKREKITLNISLECSGIKFESEKKREMGSFTGWGNSRLI
jgi:hypothetical protein